MTLQSRTILKSSAIISLLSVGSVAITFLLQVYLARYYGAAAEMDAYLAASTIPNLIMSVFLTSLSITFIPVFIEFELNSEQDAWKIAQSFILLITLVLAVLTIALIVYAQPLTSLIVPGLVRFETTFTLAIQLQRILLVSAAFTAVGGLLSGIFYAKKYYFIPSLGPLLCNGIAFSIVLIFIDQVGIVTVAYGVLIGAIAQLLFLGGFLLRIFSFNWDIDFRHSGVKRIILLMIPWLTSAIIYKANPLVDRFIASEFEEGSIAILGYALSVVTIGTFVATKGVSLAIFPMMSDTVTRLGKSALHQVIDPGLRLVLTTVVPLFILLVSLGTELVSFLFGSSEFSSNATNLTALAVYAYSGAFVATSLGNVISYAYYALQNTRIPAIVGIIGMGINIIFALLFKDILGFIAPALSYSLMAFFNLLVLIIILHRITGRLLKKGFFGYLIKVFLAGVFMALALFAIINSQIELDLYVSLIGEGYQFIWQAACAILVYGVVWLFLNFRFARNVMSLNKDNLA